MSFFKRFRYSQLDLKANKNRFYYAAVVYYDKISRLINKETGDLHRLSRDAYNWYGWCHDIDCIDIGMVSGIYKDIAPGHEFVRVLQFLFMSYDDTEIKTYDDFYLSPTTAQLIHGVLNNTLSIQCIQCVNCFNYDGPDLMCSVCHNTRLEKTTLLDDFRIKILRDSLLDDGWPDDCRLMFDLAFDKPRFKGVTCIDYLKGRVSCE